MMGGGDVVHHGDELHQGGRRRQGGGDHQISRQSVCIGGAQSEGMGDIKVVGTTNVEMEVNDKVVKDKKKVLPLGRRMRKR